MAFVSLSKKLGISQCAFFFESWRLGVLLGDRSSKVGYGPTTING
jgi:hypothetical protein